LQDALLRHKDMMQAAALAIALRQIRWRRTANACRFAANFVGHRDASWLRSKAGIAKEEIAKEENEA
jgi:hypothetical protein